MSRHRAIQFSSFSGHFREGRDSEIARTEDRPEHQVRITGQLNGSGPNRFCVYTLLRVGALRDSYCLARNPYIKLTGLEVF